MATIDELVIKYVLDPSGLKQGAKEAATAADKLSEDIAGAAEKGEKAQTTALAQIIQGWNAMILANRKAAEANVRASKDIVKATESVAQSGEKVIRTFGALFLLFAGAGSIKSFTTDMVNLDATVGRLAHNTGTTTEVISGIGRAAERLGGSFEGAMGGIKGLSDAYQDLRLTGTSAVMEPLARLQGLSGKTIAFGKDVHANILSIADALHVLEERGQSALADRLGRQILGDEGLTNLAKQGGAAMRAAESASPKITKQQAEDAQQLQARLAAVRQGFQDIGNAIILDFGPAMIQAAKYVKGLVDEYGPLLKTKIQEWVKSAGEWFKEHKGDIDAFSTAIGSLSTSVSSALKSIDENSVFFTALTALGTLAGTTLTKQFGDLTKALGSLGAVSLPGWFVKLAGLGAVAGLAEEANRHGILTPPQGDDPVRDVIETYDPARLWGGDNRSVKDRQNKGDTRNWWQRIAPSLLGGRDEPKIKDSIIDTAKATGEMRDLMRAQRDGIGAGIRGGRSSGGGYGAIGGHAGAPNMRYGRGGHTPGTDPYPGQGGSSDTGGARATAGIRARNLGNIGYFGQREPGLIGPSNSRDVDHSVAMYATQEDGIRAAARLALRKYQGGMRNAAELIAGRRGWTPNANGPGASVSIARAMGLTNQDDLHLDRPEMMRKFLHGLAMQEHGKAGDYYTPEMIDRALSGKGATTATGPGAAAGPRGSYPDWMDDKSRRELAAINAPLAQGLLAASSETGIRFRVLQGMRSAAEAENNARRGVGVRNSQHLYGAAADIRLTDAGGRDLDRNSPEYERYAQSFEAFSRSRGGNARWLGHSPGWSWDRAHFDQGIGYGQSHARDPYGAGGPTKSDVVAGNREAYTSPENPFGTKTAATAVQPSVTVGHAVRHFLSALHRAQRLTHHNDNHPVPVVDKDAMKLNERTFGTFIGWGKRHPDALDHNRAMMHGRVAAYGHMVRAANAGRYVSSSNRSVSNTSDTTINGGIHVHTAATDAKGIVADIEPHLRRGQAAGRADYGLA